MAWRWGECIYKSPEVVNSEQQLRTLSLPSRMPLSEVCILLSQLRNLLTQRASRHPSIRVIML